MQDAPAPSVFIGKPCDLTALRNYAEVDPRVDELVRYWLTMVCGGCSGVVYWTAPGASVIRVGNLDGSGAPGLTA